jgi:hypothetical protein
VVSWRLSQWGEVVCFRQVGGGFEKLVGAVNPGKSKSADEDSNDKEVKAKILEVETTEDERYSPNSDKCS